MENSPAMQRLSGMIPVARFFSAEEAEELSSLASEAGVLAVVADPKRLPQGFDGSLGGFDASQAYTVYAAPESVPALAKKLESAITMDPMDPLCALSNAELRAIVEAPLKANITEWALARKLLASRGPGDDKVRTHSEMAAWAQDEHAEADARLARWLGGTVIALFSVAVAVGILSATDSFGMGDHLEDRMQTRQAYGDGAASQVWLDPLEGAHTVLIPPLLTVAASLALIFSWRLLGGGRWRWMFPGGWRNVGWWVLMITAGILALSYTWLWWSVFSYAE